MNSLLGAIDGRRAALTETSSVASRRSLPDALRRRGRRGGGAVQEGERARPASGTATTTVFTTDLSHEKSIKSRLGWLRSPTLMRSKAAELTAFAGEIKAAGFTDVVLLGMGGSSLCPEVLSRVYATGARS